MFVVGEAGWAGSIFDLLTRLRVRGGDVWRGGTCGHVGGGYAVNGAGPLLCYVNVVLHVGMRGCEVGETSACIPVIGGVDYSALGSGPVGGG